MQVARKPSNTFYQVNDKEIQNRKTKSLRESDNELIDKLTECPKEREVLKSISKMIDEKMSSKKPHDLQKAKSLEIFLEAIFEGEPLPKTSAELEAVFIKTLGNVHSAKECMGNLFFKEHTLFGSVSKTEVFFNEQVFSNTVSHNSLFQMNTKFSIILNEKGIKAEQAADAKPRGHSKDRRTPSPTAEDRKTSSPRLKLGEGYVSDKKVGKKMGDSERSRTPSPKESSESRKKSSSTSSSSSSARSSPVDRNALDSKLKEDINFHATRFLLSIDHENFQEICRDKKINLDLKKSNESLKNLNELIAKNADQKDAMTTEINSLINQYTKNDENLTSLKALRAGVFSRLSTGQDLKTILNDVYLKMMSGSEMTRKKS